VSVPPLLFAFAMWFLGTALVVWLDSRPRATFSFSLRAGSLVALAAMGTAAIAARDASVGAAYAGFAAAILIWGWHEMAFLMGAVAGPNRAPCPPNARGWRRFRLATATVIHHEVALAAQLLLLVALCWGQPNQTAPIAFAVLFALRLSAKLNLFLGVANLSDEVFPAHLAYLKTYFGHRRINALFPVSLAFGTAIAVWAWQSSASAAPGAQAGLRMIAALAALGVVEHLFLVLPLRDGAMWRWASAAKPAAAPALTIEEGR
jgi:putative photosynthetic complex assembly protein 2